MSTTQVSDWPLCITHKTEANSITKALKTELTKESQFPDPEPQWVDYLIKISTFSTGFKDSVSHNTKVSRIQFKITRHMKTRKISSDCTMQLIDTNSEMTQMLESSDRDFKESITKCSKK